VERIIRSRTTAPPSRWPATKPKKQPDADTRAQVLLRQLADARRFEAVVVVTRMCNDIADLNGASAATQAELDDAVRDAHLCRNKPTSGASCSGVWTRPWPKHTSRRPANY
jgi:hypothetical protein